MNLPRYNFLINGVWLHTFGPYWTGLGIYYYLDIRAHSKDCIPQSALAYLIIEIIAMLIGVIAYVVVNMLIWLWYHSQFPRYK